MVAQPFSEYFRGVLVARNGRRGNRADRQTDADRRTDVEISSQAASSLADECLLVFAYFTLMTLFCLLRVE